MTEEDILKMQGGREMDRLIAEKVMGYETMWWSLQPSDEEPAVDVLKPGKEGDMPILQMCVAGEWIPVPNYSGNLKSIWTVLNRVSWYNITKFVDGWYRVRVRVRTYGPVGESSGADLPITVCRATLLSVLYDQEGFN